MVIPGAELSAAVGDVAPALELRGIEKRFGAVQANRHVSLRVPRGSVHGLIGENGAGKSTLMNIVYGYYPPDAGEIFVGGKKVTLTAPHRAIAEGIGMVHQHFMLVENFSVLENVMLGAEGAPLLAAGRVRARAALADLAREHGLDVPLDTPVGTLSVGLQQRVEILKALYRRAEILILDEPTAVLTPAEADQLFVLLGRLRAQGKTIILVTHKLREIMAITDRVTVMRQGAVVAEVETRHTTARELAEKMVGRSLASPHPRNSPTRGTPVLRVKNLTMKNSHGVVCVRAATFALHPGEIVGIAGVSGNGQSELLEVLAGTLRASAGEIHFGEHELVAENLGPAARRKLGLAHVPEDRLRMGMVADFSAEENAILGYHGARKYRRGVLLDGAAITEKCAAKMSEFDVRPAQPKLRLGFFSGGNQQKLVLAREIESDPAVLIVGQPTRGVDIGAIEFIHARLLALRAAGKALLVVSVELDEIFALADRILVMHAGEIVGDLAREEASEQRVGRLMAGLRETAA